MFCWTLQEVSKLVLSLSMVVPTSLAWLDCFFLFLFVVAEKESGVVHTRISSLHPHYGVGVIIKET